VRAGDAPANFSPSSAIDLAAIMSGESATIGAGAPVLAVDLVNLRIRVNAARVAGGLSATSFTGGGAAAIVLATDIIDLSTVFNHTLRIRERDVPGCGIDRGRHQGAASESAARFDAVGGFPRL
jgi:hypothetical protein